MAKKKKRTWRVYLEVWDWCWVGQGSAQGIRRGTALPPRDTGRTTTPVEVEEDVHDHRDVRRGGRGVGACGGPAASHGFASVFRGRVDGSTRLALPHSGAPRLKEGVQLKAYVARLNFPTIRETLAHDIHYKRLVRTIAYSCLGCCS